MGATERSASVRNLLPRRARLNRPEEFGRVFAENRRASDDLFTVLARLNDCGYARLGLAISRKAVRRAVDRNRLKRAVREHFRLTQHGMPALDIVVLARTASATSTNEELRRSLQRLWQKVTARCKS